MIEFDIKPLHLVIDEIKKLAPLHMEQLIEEKEYPDIDIDWDYYLSSSYQGHVWVVFGRKDGEMFAYSVFSISNNPNYKKHYEATNCVFFVKEEDRGRASHELFKKSTEFLKKMGVEEISYSIRDRRMGRLLARHGYEPKQVQWSLKNVKN